MRFSRRRIRALPLQHGGGDSRPEACSPISTAMKMLRVLLMTVAATAFTQAVAHEPGLSKVDLRSDGAYLHLSSAFAPTDVDFALVSRSVTAPASSLSREQRFAALVETQPPFSINLSLDSALDQDRASSSLRDEIVLEDYSVFVTDANIVRITARAPLPAQGQLSLRAPMLTWLPRDHRQLVTFRDINDNVSGTALLSRAHPVAGPWKFVVEHSNNSRAVIVEYVVHGITHILQGVDHLVFLLLLVAPLVRSSLAHLGERHRLSGLAGLALTVSAFTVAHTVTLAMTVLGFIQPPAALVEPLIAATVLYTAWHNLYAPQANSRVLLAAGFGLIHGAGFAGFLTDLGFSDHHLITSLVGFSLGVETGQLLVLLVAIPLLSIIHSYRQYRPTVIRLGSATGGGIAAYWLWGHLAT